MNQSFETSLRPTPILNSNHPEVAAYAAARTEGARSDLEAAVQLYYAVRDDIRYDPYSAVISADGLSASRALAARRAWCVPKAALLTACCRARGIPARVGFADVRNHLATARMREDMQTEIFYWHGYSAIHLEGKWLKATPAFNLTLCQKAKILPLEFDGRDDAIFQPFDAEGNRHMEYLRMHGEFDDVPLDRIRVSFEQHYAHMLRSVEGETILSSNGDFESEVDAETSAKT
jgi:transglutaminase-like putative cysteine protease